jgi:hypothetical protein
MVDAAYVATNTAVAAYARVTPTGLRSLESVRIVELIGDRDGDFSGPTEMARNRPNGR